MKKTNPAKKILKYSYNVTISVSSKSFTRPILDWYLQFVKLADWCMNIRHAGSFTE